ncbi:hypothetical protein [Kitasatospora sp. NPDC057500]|uniref:hypothetical protein n=1 Tax=Kitasatospora sp. NPDC057500 TaxID=3346151 RepID=UPI00369EBE95
MSSETVSGSPDLVVTVHFWEPGGVLGRRLAYGFMTSAATVLVPDPPEELSSPWQRYLVRISPAPGSDDTADTILAGGIGLAAVDGAGIRTAGAVLTLVRPTRFEVPAVFSTPAGIAALLIRHHGDLWAAYAELGLRVVRPKRKEPGAPDTWWLGPATAAFVHSDVKAFGWGICCSSPMCRDAEWKNEYPSDAAA